MSHPYREKARQLRQILDQSLDAIVRYRRWGLIRLLSGSLLLAVLTLLPIEMNGYLSPAIKSSILISTTLLLFLWVIIRFRRRKHTWKDANYATLLRPLGSQGKQILSAIDLEQDELQQESLFLDAAIEKNLLGIDLDAFRNSVREIVQNHPGYRFYRHAGAVTFLLFSVLIFMLSVYPDGMMRTLTFWKTYIKPNPYQYVVHPGSIVLEQGAYLEPEIQFTGDRLPERVLFSYKTDIETEFRERLMTPGSENDGGLQQFVSMPVEVTADILYQIRMDEFRSELYRAEVRILPRFDDLVAELIPPVYTGLPRSVYRYPFSEIPFYRGSEIRFTATSNKPVSPLAVVTAGERQTINPTDSTRRSFEFSMAPVQADSLLFEMEDMDGLVNRNPYQLLLNKLDDQSPAVVILDPSADLLEYQPDELRMRYRATDDFGIEKTELRWTLERLFESDVKEGIQELPIPGIGAETDWVWNLEALGLRPRDTLTFWIQVMDNDAVAGGKWGESQRITLKVPSLSEFFEELGEEESDTAADLDQVSEQFEEMEQEYERFLEKMRENPDGGYEEQEMLEGVSEQQKELDESIEALKEQFEKLQQELSENETLSAETRAAYEELQQLMQELNSPELQQALDQLREAMEEMRPEQIEKALEDVEFNEELYRERIERTKELFKELKMNSDLDKLAMQYEDMAERIQKELSLEELEKEMARLEQDMQSLEKQLEELTKERPERHEKDLQSLQEEAKEALKEMQEKLAQMQEEAAGQREESEDKESDRSEKSSGDSSKSEESEGQKSEGSSEPSEQLQQDQQNLGEQMMQQAENIRQKKGQMGGQQIQVNLQALELALLRLLDLSEEQERLSLQTIRTRDRSVGFVDLAQRQNQITRQFGAVADSLFKISSEVPGIPNTVNRKKAETERVLLSSIEQMSERNQSGSVIRSRESLSGINDLASMISSLLEQLMNQSGGGAGGGSMSMEQMLEQMQQMSGDQQQLNQQMQQMVNDMQGNRLSQEQSERLDQLAKQQNEIRKQLQELQRSGSLEEGDKLMSDLERMIEQMEDSINDLRGGMTDPLMINRQQQILSRMLDAEKSLQQRGEEETREGREAEDNLRVLPPEMTLEQLEREIRAKLQDPDYTRFEEDIQRLIERYFEQMRRAEEQPVP